jgi:tetratricopeptide (TPR) repeat protein
MKAYVSGQAGAAVEIGGKPRVYQLDVAPVSAWHAQDALRIFDGCSDVRAVIVDDATKLHDAVVFAWAADRAVRLFLMLLDPSEPSEELPEYAECIEELLESQETVIVLERTLYAAPLPGLIDVVRVQQACSSAPRLLEFFGRLLNSQDAIAQVRDALDAVPLEAFGNESQRTAILQNLVEDGSFFRTVSMVEEAKDLNFQRMEILSRYRATPTVVTKWFSGLQGEQQRLPKSLRRAQMLHEDEDEFEELPDQRQQPNYAAYLKVLSQQKAIINKLKQRDLNGARSFMTQMIRSQERDSTADQIAKSYSSMAQQAKFQEVPDLQREWAEQATLVNPNDPVTFGHLADALISIHEYNQARDALDQVEAKGDPLFAANGRARVLRQMGCINEAREVYLLAAKKYADLPNVSFALIGAAEALREMGDASAAQAEYRAITERFPLEPAAWAGLATTLMEAGGFAEAIITFGKAASHDRRTALAKAGKAKAYRLSGELDKAQTLYEEILHNFPNNLSALCGRGKIFQLRGENHNALEAFDEAIVRSPYSPDPIIGKASVLRDMGNFSQSMDLYRSGIMRFQYDRRLPSGVISVLRAQGRFSEALVMLDETISRFPFDIELIVSRAAVLSRLGANNDSIAAYDSAIERKPFLKSALLGKAALLIKLDRMSEASRLLPDIEPKTRFDWRQIMLRALLLERTEGFHSAVAVLEREVRRCPFLVERRRMRDILVSLEIGRNRLDLASQLIEEAPLEVSNIVAFHVFAALRRSTDALKKLQQIRSSEGPAEVIELATEIARRHNLLDEPPQHSAMWIMINERHMLLAEAA